MLRGMLCVGLVVLSQSTQAVVIQDTGSDWTNTGGGIDFGDRVVATFVWRIVHSEKLI